ncbi:MAG TPA: hypothetical protein P5186_19940 [Candidatus Paceibacterota bacterium]|nr:hypothetical protein [Verrucomicrobiota bacterium]HRY50331.1 hypothetical protein [Candidatus Paceibacterota bacterium]
MKKEKQKCRLEQLATLMKMNRNEVQVVRLAAKWMKINPAEICRFAAVHLAKCHARCLDEWAKPIAKTSKHKGPRWEKRRALALEILIELMPLLSDQAKPQVREHYLGKSQWP